MTIEEAIVYYEQEAEIKERMAERIGNQLVGSAVANYQEECLDCAKEYRQLIVWLLELKDLRSEQNEENVFISELMKENKELKKLLKIAIEDIYNARHGSNCAICRPPSTEEEAEKRCQSVENYNPDCGFQWLFEDEACELTKENE